jgi:hypothetical protein
MNPAIVALLAQLAEAGLQVYTTMHSAATAPNQNLAIVSALIPVAAGISQAMLQAGGILQQAQSEKWLDNDPRWLAPFSAADTALAAAEARLT